MMYKNQEGYADPTAGQALANIRREEKARLGYMPLVYICSPFRGDVENNIYATYNALMSSGWKFDEIDRMDMLGFLSVRAWQARRENQKKTPRRAYIDEVWPDLK